MVNVHQAFGPYIYIIFFHLVRWAKQKKFSREGAGDCPNRTKMIVSQCSVIAQEMKQYFSFLCCERLKKVKCIIIKNGAWKTA